MSENDKTIYNSFKNITKLYGDVSKMLYEMDSQFRDEKFIPNMRTQNAICRWKSDQISAVSGWRVDSVARSYCLTTEEENSEENNRLIVIIIQMNYEILHLTFGLYTYKRNISKHKFGIGDHWLIDDPLNPHNNNQFIFNYENEYMIQSTPVNEKVSKTYLGLIKSIFLSVRLFEIKDKDALNNLMILPSIRLFKGEKLEIKSFDNSSYLSSRDYQKLHE